MNAFWSPRSVTTASTSGAFEAAGARAEAAASGRASATSATTRRPLFKPENPTKPAATLSVRADVAELVDAHGSGPCGRKPVEVQVLSSALLDVAASRAVSVRVFV